MKIPPNRSILSGLCALLFGVSASVGTFAGTPQESGFTENTFISNATSLGLITSLAWASDGSNRLFISRKAGEIRIVKNGALLSTPFATVTVETNGEAGIETVCLDPNFAVNKYVYAFIVATPTSSRVIRFTANGDVGTSQTTILDNIPSGGWYHNGGGMGFGPDGKLYFAVGDNRAHVGEDGDLISLGSKVGRINPGGGAALSDNPFNDGTGPNNDHIWARGFRNPFKMCFRPGGQLWLNVAGETGEQIFLVKRGEHGGWNNYENNNQPTGFIKPKIYYPSHAASFVGTDGCVTGGCFYDSTQFPSSHRGAFFFTDYVSQVVMKSGLSGDTAATPTKFVTGVANAVTTATGPDGALYYVEHTNGVVRRLRHTGAGQDLVVWPTWVNMTEGGLTSVMVSLKVAPAANVTVNVARSAGDSDVNISAGSTLTFTTSNWNVPQKVTVAATADGDSTNDAATLAVSSSGLTTQNVSVNVADTGGTFVLSKSTMTITEGTSSTFTAKLSAQPAQSVTVTSTRSSGDSSVSVTGGGTLTFTTSNWSTAQTVTVTAADDADTTTDSAVISVSAPGYVTNTVSVTATDNDSSAPVITSSADTTAVVNANYQYDVDATGTPTPTYSLASAPAGMTIDATSGLISWTPSATGSYPVSVTATNGVSPNATQSYTLVVSVDQPPIASLTQPVNGAVVSGRFSEFYGDGFDDVGTVEAEFYVDGILKWTDLQQGHFHYNGAHNLWDTTQLADGAHTLTFKVFDTAGQTDERTVNVTVSNSVPTNTYQAENAVLGGGTFVESTNTGYNGTGYVNAPATGGTTTFNNVDGNGGGTKALAIRYANGSTASRTGNLTVNGATVSVTFPITGGWTTWTTLNVNVALNSGTSNTIQLASTGQDLANIDEITVPPSAPTPDTYQAESAVLGGGTFVESTNTGYNGTGYVNSPATGGTTTFNNVDGNGGGAKVLAIRYANATTPRTGSLIVNGATISVTFPATGAWTTWATLNVSITLNNDTSNTIQLTSTGQDLANIDEITVP